MEEIKGPDAVRLMSRDYVTRRWNLPAQNKNFTGRQNLLDQISERLSGSKPLVITACHGLGGVGKTQLVTEFAYRNEKKYERIIWIPSESTEQIETAYLLLGQDLGITPEKTPPAEAILMVKAWLIKHPRNLVIFDNAPDKKTVEGYELSSGADILITSRNKDWEGGLAVDVFSLEDAVLYFRKIVGERECDTKEKIEELAEELGRLPLALAQAAAYIRQNKISIQAYLDLYQEKKSYLLSLSVLPEGDRHVAVHVTWDITMERIRQESILAPAMLNICSYLHSEKIPALLLEKFCEDERYNPERRETLEEARGCLRSYSMVSVDEEDDSVSVHRLVQDVSQLKLDTTLRNEYVEGCFNICMKCFPEENLLDEIALIRVLHPHLEALLTRIDEETCLQRGMLEEESREKNFVLPLLYALAASHGLLGSVKKSKMFLVRELSVTKKHYDERHVVTSDVMVRLGELCFTLGEAQTARDLLEEALEIRFAHFGENQMPIKDTQIYGSLSNIFMAMGDFKRSRELLKYILPIQTAILGEQHWHVASTLMGLGWSYIQSHNMVKARDYFERALAIQKVIHQKTPFLVANTLGVLGQIYGELGDAQKQKEVLESALPILEEHYGKESYMLIPSLSGLSNSYHTLDDMPRRKVVLERCLAISKSHYGEEHSETALVMHQLGCMFSEEGELDIAKDLLEKSLRIQEALYGFEHREISTTLNSLGIVCHELRRHTEAREYLKRGLRIQKRVYGKNHVMVCATLNSFANLEWDLGDRETAHRYWQRALTINQDYYGREHPEVALMLLSIAVANFREGNFQRTLQYASEAYVNLRGHPDAGPHHMLTQRTAALLREVFFKVAKPDVKMIERYLGDNPSDAEVRLSLAEFYLNHNRLERSIFHYQHSIPLLVEDNLANAHHNLGCLYAVQGEVTLADQQFRLALGTRVAASTYCDYGLFLYNQKRFEVMRDNLSRVFSLTEDKSRLCYGKLEFGQLDNFLQREIQLYGDLNVQSIIMAYYWIVRCYQQLGEPAECENYLTKFREAVEISAEPLCWRLLNYTYEYLGRTNEAEECREMLSAIEFSKQMTDAEAAAQFGLHPSPPRALKREKLAEAEEKLVCKK